MNAYLNKINFSYYHIIFLSYRELQFINNINVSDCLTRIYKSTKTVSEEPSNT